MGWVWVSSGWAQQQPPTPQLISIYPAGAQTGKTVDLKIVEQSELEFADGLIFSHPGITAGPKMQPSNRFFPKPVAVRNVFEVSVGKNVPAGVYEVRAQCEYGISNPRRFVVSAHQEFLENEPNDNIEKANPLKAGSTVNGTFEAGYDFYRLEIKKGQSLVFHCVSELIDSRGDPVMALLDSNQKIVAKNHDTLGRDSLVSYKAAESGTFFVRVNDLTFASQGGAGTTPYRLTVSESPWIDFVDPPVIPQGVNAKVKLFGRNLGGIPSGLQKNGIELELREVTLNSNAYPVSSFSQSVVAPNRFSRGRFAYQYEGTKGKSNVIFMQTAELPIVLEQELQGPLKVGSCLLGTFSETGEVDRYRFEAKQGETFRIEVVSHGLGMGTDPLLTLSSVIGEKEEERQVKKMVTVDDFQPLTSPFRLQLDTVDPATLFEAKTDGQYEIAISDQFNLPPSHNGKNYYALIFRRPADRVELVAFAGLPRGQNDNNNQPLKILPCIVRPMSAAEIQVVAYRSPGFESSIEFKVDGLPPGVLAEPTLMASSQNTATIILRGSADLKPGLGKIRITGTYVDQGEKVSVPVNGAEITTNSVGNEPSESRLTDELYVIGDTSIRFPGKIEISGKEFEISRGGAIEAKAMLKKHPSHKGQVLQAGVYGLPKTVNKNTNTMADSGAEVTFKIEFRQGSPAGDYTAFIRGYFEGDSKRFEKQFEQVTAEQKRIAGVQQKLESQYRQATQQQQRLTQQIASSKQTATRLASQVRQQTASQSQAKMKIKSAEKEKERLAAGLNQLQSAITGLNKEVGSEKEPQKKANLIAELAQKESRKKTTQAALEQATKTLQAAQSAGQGIEQKMVSLGKQEAELKEKMAKLLEEQKNLTKGVDQFAQERNLLKTIKTTVDQDFNLARQAAQTRKRRFLVYSDPFRIKVTPFPIEVSLSQPGVSMVAGSGQKFRITIKRKYDFKGAVTFQLIPANEGKGWRFRSNPRLNADQNQVEVEVVAQKNATLGVFKGELLATMRVGNTNLTQTLPLAVEVKAAPANAP